MSQKRICYSHQYQLLFPLAKLIFFAVVLSSILPHADADAFDPLDSFGNITIKWDVMSWTPDGYVAYNEPWMDFMMELAKQRSDLVHSGSQTTEQGDCSKFKGNVPHCCKMDPVLVDLLPGVPYNQQFSNCKGGVLASWGEDLLEHQTRQLNYPRISVCLVQDQATLVAPQK